MSVALLPQPPRQLSVFPEDNQQYDDMQSLLDLLLDPQGRAERAKAVAEHRKLDLGPAALGQPGP